VRGSKVPFAGGFLIGAHVQRRTLMKHSPWRPLAADLTLAGALALSLSAPPAAAQENFVLRKPIEGVWQVTRHGVNCDTGQVLSTFQAIAMFGRAGSLSSYGVPPGGTPAFTSPEYGTWKSEPGPGRYSARWVSNSYDAGGAVSGSTQVSAALTLAGDARSLEYDATISFFDAAGNLQFSACGHATATRF
jgi:hypothetical protein